MNVSNNNAFAIRIAYSWNANVFSLDDKSTETCTNSSSLNRDSFECIAFHIQIKSFLWFHFTLKCTYPPCVHIDFKICLIIHIEIVAFFRPIRLCHFLFWVGVNDRWCDTHTHIHTHANVVSIECYNKRNSSVENNWISFSFEFQSIQNSKKFCTKPFIGMVTILPCIVKKTEQWLNIEFISPTIIKRIFHLNFVFMLGFMHHNVCNALCVFCAWWTKKKNRQELEC